MASVYAGVGVTISTVTGVVGGLLVGIMIAPYFYPIPRAVAVETVRPEREVHVYVTSPASYGPIVMAWDARSGNVMTSGSVTGFVDDKECRWAAAKMISERTKVGISTFPSCLDLGTGDGQK